MSSNPTFTQASVRNDKFVLPVTFATSANSPAVNIQGLNLIGFATGTMVGTTLEVQVSLDGITFRTLTDATTGAALYAPFATGSNGAYAIPNFAAYCAFPWIRLVSSSASETGTVTLLARPYV